MQKENIVGPYSEYNIELAQKFRKIQARSNILFQELTDIEKQIDDNPKESLDKIIQISREQFKLLYDAHALIPFQRAQFNTYAKQMMNTLIEIISNNKFLTYCVVEFDNLGIATKELFGKVLFHKMAAKYNDDKITQTNFVIKRFKRLPQAEYDWENTITFKQNKQKYITDILYFLPAFLHEFSHYIYVKKSDKSPFGAQNAYIACNSVIPASEKSVSDKKQMNQPFEKPSYELMSYFFKYGTPEKLCQAIVEKHK